MSLRNQEDELKEVLEKQRNMEYPKHIGEMVIEEKSKAKRFEGCDSKEGRDNENLLGFNDTKTINILIRGLRMFSSQDPLTGYMGYKL